MNKTEAMIESIRLRTRPVVMTSCAVSVGMLPVALGSAIVAWLVGNIIMEKGSKSVKNAIEE